MHLATTTNPTRAMNRHAWISTTNQPKRHAQAVRQDDRRAPASAERALWAATVLRRAGWY